MKLFSRRFTTTWIYTIRTKLAVVITLLIGGISIFIFYYFPARLEDQQIRAIDAKAHSIIEMTAFSVSPALYFEDRQGVMEGLKGARQNRDMVYIIVLDDSGQAFAAVNREMAVKANFIATNHNGYASQAGDVYRIMHPILHNDRQIGELYLGLSLKELKAKIARSRTNIAFISLIIFAIGMIAVFAISTVVTKPLSRMVETVEQIAKGDLTRRAPVSSPDEVGHLARAFNLMVENLESTHRQLEEINRTLEKRVEERTEKLQREVNERKRTEEALRESEERYRTLIESQQEGVAVVDAEGRFVFANPAAHEIFGLPPGNLSGKSLKEFVDSEDFSLIRAQTKERQSAKRIDYELEIIRPEGEKRTLLVTASPRFDNGGRFTGTFGVFRDITERKRAEQEKEELQGQLFQVQKMKAVGTLAGGVAHDFNNLLTAIKGYAELALSKVDSDDSVHKYLTKLHYAGEQAANLTRQLLLFSRKQPMQIAAINVNNTIKSFLEMLGRLICEDIDIDTELSSDLWTVQADEGNIEQVIMNLAVNARDAMPKGGRLIIRTENMTLDAEYCKAITDARPGKFVCVSVTDTGIGMERATLERIFEPFFSTKGPGEGTGLGLAVVYGIVKEHKGWVNVYSEPGRGSTFRVYLPVYPGRQKQETEEEIPLQELQGGGERILLVEDEEAVREFAIRALGENGYAVFATTSAEEALEIFKREKGRFHLIFSDIVLPGRSGLQLVDQLLAGHSELPILLSSGYSDDKSHWADIRERGFRFLQKPYSVRQLLQSVKEVLRHTEKTKRKQLKRTRQKGSVFDKVSSP